MKILLKTHKADIKRAVFLLKDLSKYSKLETFVVSDKPTLSEIKSKVDQNNLNFLNEDIFFSGKEFSAPGYIQQQIVKLKFSSIINSDYFCIDSDCRIIKEMPNAMFYDKHNNLYDFVDIDCIVENFVSWNNKYYYNRSKYLSFIKRFFNLEHFITSHGLCSLNYKILNEMFS